jgi:hypothetical protein
MNDERKLDALLRDWAVSPPPSLVGSTAGSLAHDEGLSDEGWDAAASAIVAKAQAAGAIDGSEMDRLWAPPALTPETGEPQSQFQAAPRVTSGDKKMSDDRDPPSTAPRSLRKGGSLKELAERVSKAPPSSAISVPPAAPSPRTSSPDVAPATKASATPLPASAPPSSIATPIPASRESVPPASVPVAAAASTLPSEKPANDAGPRSKTPETLPTGQAPAARKSGGAMWGLVGGGLVALAAAAGAALYLNHAKQTNGTNAPQAANTSAPAKTANAADTSDEPAGRVQAKDDRPKEDPNAIDVDKLGDATAEVSAEPEVGGPLPFGAKPPATAVASNEKDGPQRVDPDGTLDDAMKKAAGVDGEAQQDKPEAAAGDTHPKNLPDLPPTGSVTAAVGSVRGAARACVAGADSDSSAVITFGSSGAAQSVSVGGWAAGKPAAGCIRSALMGAHVEPFTKPSFSAPMTIRP